MAVKLLLVRECATPWLSEGRVQGRIILPPLAEELSEMRAIAPELAELSPEAVYVPPQDPGLASGQIFSEELGLPLWKRDELLPLDMGIWEGLCWSEVKERYGRMYRRWQSAPETYAPPQGETVAEVGRRLSVFLQEMLGLGETIIVVASTSTLSAFFSQRILEEEQSGEEAPWQLSAPPQQSPRWSEHEVITGED